MGVSLQKPMMKLLLPVAIFAFVISASASETCEDLRVPAGMCATIYDDEDCNGWSVDVPTGYTELSFRERNEAEAVIVKPGCKFIGYDRADKNIIANRGDSITIDATNNATHVWMNLEGEDNLEEEISSTVCTCDQVPSSPLALAFGIGVSGPSRPRPFLPTDNDNVARVPTKFGARIPTEKATTASTSTTKPAPISQCSSEAEWSGKQCARFTKTKTASAGGLMSPSATRSSRALRGTTMLRSSSFVRAVNLSDTNMPTGILNCVVAVSLLMLPFLTNTPTMPTTTMERATPHKL